MKNLIGRECDVLFIIEHKDREFEIYNNVAKYLKSMFGLNSIILSRFYHAHLFPFIKTKSIVCATIMGLNDWPIASFTSTRSNIKYINANFEQYICEASADYKSPKDCFTRGSVFQLCWEQDFLDYLVSNKVQEDNVFITGRPLDSLIRRSTLNENLKFLNSLDSLPGYDIDKRTMFFPMNYGWAFMSESQIDERIKNGYNKETASKYKEYSRLCLQRFVSFIDEVQSLYGDEFNIVVRPHPSVHPQKYKDLDGWNNNIVVTHDYSIVEWLSISDIVGSSWSTTILDAKAINKLHFLFTPYERPSFLDVDWNHNVPNLCQATDIRKLLESKLAENNATELSDDPIVKTAEVINQILIGRHLSPHDVGNVELVSRVKRYASSIIKIIFMKVGLSEFVPSGQRRDYFKVEIV